MRLRLFLLLLLTVLTAGGALLLEEQKRRGVGVHVLDVGQGDSILLRSGNADILVDGGPDATVLQRLSEIRPVSDRRLDVLIMTHPQRDHFAGFFPLLERERVGLVILPEIPSETDLFRAFIAELRHRQIPVRFARVGQQVTVGALTLTVLAPDKHLLELARKNPNHGSIVLRVDVEGETKTGNPFSVLLTGDIERMTEQYLSARIPTLVDVDVLKVPHHGSKTSTSDRFLRAVTPRLALISTGKGNSYGHPAPVILQRLKHTPLFRTDLHGTVSLRATDESLLLSCARGCAFADLAADERDR